MTTATTLADQALKAFNSSDYTSAVDLYSKALAQNPEALEYYVKRSIAYQRSSQYELALKDAEISLILANKRGKREAIGSAQLRRGIALFLLKKYGDAGFCFNLAEKRLADKEKNMLGMWRKKLEMELEKLDEDDEKREVMVEEYPQMEIPKAAVKEAVPAKQETAVKAIQVKSADASAHPVPEGVITPRSKIRHEWYQTPTTVVLTLYVKGVPKDRAVVEIKEKTVSVLALMFWIS
jgi:suppressor of G2 allele of SKP1